MKLWGRHGQHSPDKRRFRHWPRCWCGGRAHWRVVWLSTGLLQFECDQHASLRRLRAHCRAGGVAERLSWQRYRRADDQWYKSERERQELRNRVGWGAPA